MSGENARVATSTTTTEGSYGSEESEMLCGCGKAAIVRQAWTTTNPGRRFYTCGNGGRSVCNYFVWRDLEKPHGWQKNALLEARDIIKAQEKEIEKLRRQQTDGNERNNDADGLFAGMEKENEALKQEIKSSTEKEQMLRQVLVMSWVGFICAVATIVHGLK